MTALLLMGTPAHAQESEITALRSQIEELTARLDKMEAAAKAQGDAAAKAGNPVTTREKVTVSGLLQVHGQGFVGQDNAFPRRADTLRLRRGEVRITAPSITPRVSGTMQVDFAKAIAVNSAAGAATTVRARDNVLQEIQISYLLNKRGNNSHYIDIGQYKIPIGYESLQSSAALQTIERGLFYTQRDPSGSDQGYGDVRDSGVQVRGTFNRFDYRLGIFNGLGDRQNTVATTDPKAILGWLAYRPIFIDGLQIGVSGGGGNTALGAGNRRFNRGLFNLFGVYKKNKVTFQSEYLQGETQLRGGIPSSDVRGYYASLGYLFTPKIEGVLRYDTFDSARNLANAEARDITLGLNYYIKDNNAKIQANIIRRNGAPGSPVVDLRPDRTELRTNFQVAF
jgi:phosphate-selective porin